MAKGREGASETLEQLVERCELQGYLFTYDLVPEEEIKVSFSGVVDGIEVVQNRIIRARCVNPDIGSLEVIEDSTNTEESWLERTICLGSYAFSLAGADFQTPGLLRGTIGYEQGVVVDLRGQHFRDERDFGLPMAEYKTLHLQEQRIF